MTGPIQHFFSSILDAWRFRVFAHLAERKGFRSVQFADFKGSLQLRTSSHLRERDKMLLRAILYGGVWNGFLLCQAKKGDVSCQFCGKKDGDGHLFFWGAILALHIHEVYLAGPLGVWSDRSRDSKIFAFSCVLFPSAFCARAFLACFLLSGPSCVRLLGERLI